MLIAGFGVGGEPGGGGGGGSGARRLVNVQVITWPAAGVTSIDVPVLFATVTGVAFASRQLTALVNVPAGPPSCLPSLTVILLPGTICLLGVFWPLPTPAVVVPSTVSGNVSPPLPADTTLAAFTVGCLVFVQVQVMSSPEFTVMTSCLELAPAAPPPAPAPALALVQEIETAQVLPGSVSSTVTTVGASVTGPCVSVSPALLPSENAEPKVGLSDVKPNVPDVPTTTFLTVSCPGATRVTVAELCFGPIAVEPTWPLTVTVFTSESGSPATYWRLHRKIHTSPPSNDVVVGSAAVGFPGTGCSWS